MSDPAAVDAWIGRLLGGQVLFDTMVIRHLCAAGGGSVLVAAFAGRLAWPEAVDAELRLQANSVKPVSAFLRDARATVLEVDAADEEEVEDIRIDMYSKAAARTSDTEHLGEAQCLFFAERDGYPLVTHDGRARARGRVAGIGLFHMIDVLCACVRLGACRPARAWQLYSDAVGSGLYVLPGFEIPGSRDRFLNSAGQMRALAVIEARARE
jgi:hypothetical protein